MKMAPWGKFVNVSASRRMSETKANFSCNAPEDGALGRKHELERLTRRRRLNCAGVVRCCQEAALVWQECDAAAQQCLQNVQQSTHNGMTGAWRTGQNGAAAQGQYGDRVGGAFSLSGWPADTTIVSALREVKVEAGQSQCHSAHQSEQTTNLQRQRQEQRCGWGAQQGCW